MDSRILAALKYIEQNVSETADLGAIAARVKLSKFYFERLFRDEVGESYYAYVKRIRMHNAASRLKHTNQPVYEIAAAYGYGSNAAFTRSFRAFWGVSPTAYRSDSSSWDAEEFYRERNVGVSLDVAPNIQVREVGSYTCMFRRYYGPYTRMQEIWRDFLDRLPQVLRSGEAGAQFLGRVYDDPRVTPADEIRYDCCYVFADHHDARLQLDEVRNNLVITDAGLYAVVDNTQNPRPRPEIYAYLLDKWMRTTNYSYSDAPGLELFTENPVEANSTWAPVSTMLVPLE
jgi:AraC family transcriptional regulator